MSASTAIKQRLADLKINQIELANMLGITKQNLNNKLQRDNFSSQELDQICKVLNMKLIMVDEGKHEYLIQYDK
jgi:DNA-binding Xre family transcriptional regulator